MVGQGDGRGEKQELAALPRSSGVAGVGDDQIDTCLVRGLCLLGGIGGDLGEAALSFRHPQVMDREIPGLGAAPAPGDNSAGRIFPSGHGVSGGPNSREKTGAHFRNPAP